MRIIITLLVSTILCHPAKSQLTKGQWIVGGTADFSKNNTNNTEMEGYSFKSKTSNYEASPGFGYFVMDRLCTGLRFAVLGGKTEQEINSNLPTLPFTYYSKIETETSGFGISPFVRYYLLKPTTKWNLFVDGSYLYSNTNTEQKITEASSSSPSLPPSVSYSETSSDANVHSFILSAGPAFFLNPKVSLELSVGISHSSYEDSDITGTTFLVGVGFQVHLGK